eukprot:scaffold10715_cov114-Isochrysis_galbana.AAC.3
MTTSSASQVLGHGTGVGLPSRRDNYDIFMISPPPPPLWRESEGQPTIGWPAFRRLCAPEDADGTHLIHSRARRGVEVRVRIQHVARLSAHEEGGQPARVGAHHPPGLAAELSTRARPGLC